MKVGNSFYSVVTLLTIFLCGCNSYRIDSLASSKSQSDSDKSTLILKTDNVQTAMIIDLGKVRPDSKSDRTILVQNTSDREIVLDRFQSSCECTEVIGLPLKISGSKTAELTLVNDQRKESGFIGSLAIMIDLFEQDQVRGKLEVQVTVSKDADSQKSMEGPVTNKQQFRKADPTSPDSPSSHLREPTLAPPRSENNSNL
jgi:hypothetical protein